MFVKRCGIDNEVDHSPELDISVLEKTGPKYKGAAWYGAFTDYTTLREMDESKSSSVLIHGENCLVISSFLSKQKLR